MADDDYEEYRTPWWVAIPVLVPILCVAIWWQVYAYNDCLKVGHSKAYCILSTR